MSAGGTRYTQGHEQPTLASHGTRTAASSAAYLLPELRPGDRLLDVGCGPGSITLDLAGAVAPGAVTGVDDVEEPLVTAREQAARRGDTTTRFEVADALSLPYDDATFDVVHAHQVLQHVPDPVRVLREMARVCRPGGLLAVRDADYAAMTWWPETSGMTRWREVYRAVARANGGEPDAGRHLRAWLRAAGLTDAPHEVRLSTSTWLYADEASCRWWGESQADRYGGPVFAAQARRHGLDDAALAEVADDWRRWGSDPDAWFVVLHGEALVRLGGSSGSGGAGGS